MKLGKFQDLLDKKFTAEELAEMDREVELEYAVLKALQQNDIGGTKKRNTLFESLKAGLEEAIAHQSDYVKTTSDSQGKINLRSESIEILVPPKTCKSKTEAKCSILHELIYASE